MAPAIRSYLSEALSFLPGRFLLRNWMSWKDAGMRCLSRLQPKLRGVFGVSFHERIAARSTNARWHNSSPGRLTDMTYGPRRRPKLRRD